MLKNAPKEQIARKRASASQSRAGTKPVCGFGENSYHVVMKTGVTIP
jgi:hypothetical protein